MSNYIRRLLPFFSGLFLLTLIAMVFFFNPAWLPSFGEKKASKVEPEMQQVASQQPDSLPTVSSSDWNLILVNRTYPTEVNPPKLATVEDIELDSRIEQATKDFLAAIRQIEPEETLISGYRSKENQTELYNEAVEAAELEGLSREEAEALVRHQIQVPGASEHQTGLALDISVPSGQSDELAEQISALAPDYGFILRYPKDKSEITGVDFENWHYRYVGKESARYIVDHQLVLEEYIELLKKAGQ
ncbi:D-alanyl-D-alanine carboxypeptidase [Streptococcus himalayensis]|uniref:D-alanyl-D-alanine carboxypeptidase n=1 Tax=Streptococcus himalayensis TaxID=1888195 RepID=A0A917EF62_9STRE|nr:D-alanyl-D-alanine carboxypeptidase [Streptococcus himalayensis]